MVKQEPVLSQPRYFIVERDSLSAYGNEVGSDRKEAEQLLDDAGAGNDLVVIRGEVVKPYAKLE